MGPIFRAALPASLLFLFFVPVCFGWSAGVAGVTAPSGGAEVTEPWLTGAYLVLGCAAALIVIIEIVARRGRGYAPRNPRRFRVTVASGAQADAPVSQPVRRPPPAAPAPPARVSKPVPPPLPVRRTPMKLPGVNPVAKAVVKAVVQAAAGTPGARTRIVDTGFWLDASVARPGDRVKFRWLDAEGVHEDVVEFAPNATARGHFIYTGRRAQRVQIVAVTR